MYIVIGSIVLFLMFWGLIVLLASTGKRVNRQDMTPTRRQIDPRNDKFIKG